MGQPGELLVKSSMNAMVCMSFDSDPSRPTTISRSRDIMDDLI